MERAGQLPEEALSVLRHESWRTVQSRPETGWKGSQVGKDSVICGWWGLGRAAEAAGLGAPG